MFEIVYPVFTVEYTAMGEFPTSYVPEDVRERFAAGTVIEDSKITIQIPNAFVQTPEVGPELFAFMLAHEIGHGLADPDPCTCDYLQVCEGTADYWGATYGLQAVFDDAFPQVSRAAEAQLEAYYYALEYGMDDCGDRWCCDCTLTESCAHPPLSCRLRTIRQARWVDSRKAACTLNWAEHQPGCPDCPDCHDCPDHPVCPPCP
ncbi:MAG: hypothetical protein WAU70_17630 [Flavobacteriales bacterium]